MKLFIFINLVFLLLLATSSNTSGSEEHEYDLRIAVGAITEVIDMERIFATLYDLDVSACFDKYDPQIMKYLHGPEFRKIHNFLWTNPQFLKIIRFIADGGYPEIYEAINYIFEYLGLPHRVNKNGPIEDAIPVIIKTHKACPENILMIIQGAIPEDEVVPVLFKVFKSDHCVKEFVSMVKTPEMKAFGAEFLKLPQVQSLIEYAKTKALPVNELIYLMNRA